MKRFSARFVTVAVTLGGFWWFTNPAPLFALGFPADNNPHYAGDNNCVNHAGYPTWSEGSPQQTFTLCLNNSGATSWYAEVWKKYATAPACRWGSSSAPYTAVNGQDFNCNLAYGDYRGYIYFWVGPSQMMTVYDQYFKVP